jgi:hypothetical protein
VLPVEGVQFEERKGLTGEGVAGQMGVLLYLLEIIRRKNKLLAEELKKNLPFVLLIATDWFCLRIFFT